MANPQPDPDDRWPACDEQPPGVSIRPLRHRDLQALLAHLHHHDQDDEDEGLAPGPVGRRPAGGGPVVAVRVRASVGRPAPPPSMSIGAAEPPNAPAGRMACPGGPGPCWPPA
jgi:hypothetical protein